MQSDASANTLVCDLRLPLGLALAWAAGAVAALMVALMLPVSWWIRVAIAATAAAYAWIEAWRWRRRTPSRLVITGDGRCRGVARDGSILSFGRVRGGVVRRRFVTVRTQGRRFLVTVGMLDATQFRRLKARLRTVVAP